MPPADRQKRACKFIPRSLQIVAAKILTNIAQEWMGKVLEDHLDVLWYIRGIIMWWHKSYIPNEAIHNIRSARDKVL